jgi:hypothetical protein
VGKDWAEAHRRNPHLIAYLASYGPSHLADAPGGKSHLIDESRPEDKKRLDNGKQVFADHCAKCHSSKQPMYSLVRTKAQEKSYFRRSVAAPDFLAGNVLTDDVRYSVRDLGTNMARALATNAVEGDIWAELSSRDYKALPPLGRFRLAYGFAGGKLEAKRPSDKPADTDVTVDFVPPGGGRGYYRTPSLVSLWATAPYLHNNALGDYYVVNTRTGRKSLFPNDGRDLVDPADGTTLTIDTSVEGRVKMFQDGVEKLLWPEKRRFYIKRTETDCQLVELEPLVKRLLPGVLADLYFEFLNRQTEQAVDAFLKDKGLPAAEAEVLKLKILTEARAHLAELRRTVKPGDLAALGEKLIAQVEVKLFGAADEAGAGHAAALREKLKGLGAPLRAEAKRLLASDGLTVPKGTPINLYFNLNASSLPYALKAQIKHGKDPRALAAEMLKHSDCPDLVEDRGHTYGADLADQDKKDLIEFLKTF